MTNSPDASGNIDERETSENTGGRCDDDAVTEAQVSGRVRTRVQKQNRVTSASCANSTSMLLESADCVEHNDAEHRTSTVFDSTSPTTSTQRNSCASDSHILCHITSETHV